MNDNIKKPNKAEKLIYKALVKAVEQNRLRIYLDYGKINRPGSPVYDPWENLLPILVPVLIGLILIISAGVFFGLLFIVAMILIYSTYFKKKVYRRLIERTKGYLVSDYANCQELWDCGGIVLVNAENKKSGCVSPEGDWKEFVINNFAEYMTGEEKKQPQEENKQDEKPQSEKKQRQSA